MSGSFLPDLAAGVILVILGASFAARLHRYKKEERSLKEAIKAFEEMESGSRNE